MRYSKRTQPHGPKPNRKAVRALNGLPVNRPMDIIEEFRFAGAASPRKNEPHTAMNLIEPSLLVGTARGPALLAVFNRFWHPGLAKGLRSYYVPPVTRAAPHFCRAGGCLCLTGPMAERQNKPTADIRQITIRGAREHNLKNIALAIPRDRLVVFTGLSGSGKSSLAFDTIYAEGQRRYVESLSAYARQFLEMMQKPDVDQIDGLSPAISIEQKTTSKNPRSTVGTVTEIYDYMRLLWARIGVPYSPATGLPIESQTVSQMVDRVLAL